MPLEDSELLAEVELTTNLMIAASEVEGDLAPDDVDRLLGVDTEHRIPPQVTRRRDS